MTSPTCEVFRRRFPALDHLVHLASCSLGARSTALDAAIHHMLEDMNCGAAAWERFENEVERARRGFAALIGAAPEQIAVMPNASTGAYQAVSTLDLSRRRRFVVAAEEFPSIAHVWLAQRGRGAEVVFVNREPAAIPDATAVLEAVDSGTALVSIPLVAYESGIRWPAREVSTVAHDRGAVIFVDAYQAAGVVPVDVGDIQCDFLVAGSHKYLLGLPGCAFLYARDTDTSTLEPQLTGWFGRRDPFAFDVRRLDFPDSALRYQTGTPAIPAVYACTAGLELLGELDVREVEQHVSSLIHRLEARLAGTDEQLLIPGGHAAQGAHVGIIHPRSNELAAWLTERSISTSPRGGVLRVAFHYYNMPAEVDLLCDAIAEYRRTAMRA